METKLPTIFDMANAFLTLEAMSPKKLQKLCYYAKAWHLALEDENIINEPFEAWVFGPVNPALYQKYKQYGYNEISKDENVYPIPANIMNFAKKIYEMYGKLNAQELEDLSHNELPWIEARGDLTLEENCNNIISEETMKTYYRETVKNYYKNLMEKNKTKKRKTIKDHLREFYGEDFHKVRIQQEEYDWGKPVGKEIW